MAGVVKIETKEDLIMCSTAFDQLNRFCHLLTEKVNEELEQAQACKKNTELGLKLAEETKYHNETSERLTKLEGHISELERVCNNFESHWSITDSDKNRLDTAKETYDLEKELTGVRLDFSAPPNIAKGYVKSQPRKLLQPFEFPASDCEALWTLIQSTSDPGWPYSQDKENQKTEKNHQQLA